MLPPGLVAQPAERAHQQTCQTLHPAARTVVHLLVGACSCDLVRPRHADPRQDERQHRSRSRAAGGARDALIGALERHRLAAGVPPPPGGWPEALAAFVAEHARNAGETLYLLRYSLLPAGAPPASTAPVTRLAAAEVVANPAGWLAEDAPVLVGR